MFSAKENLEKLLAALDKNGCIDETITGNSCSKHRKLSPYQEHLRIIQEGKKIAKEYCAKNPPVIRPKYISATRSIGGEFSCPGFLKPTQFKSDWDRERCTAPQRTYPSREGAVSEFYNPLNKTDWRPASGQSRELSRIEYMLEHVETE